MSYIKGLINDFTFPPTGSYLVRAAPVVGLVAVVFYFLTRPRKLGFKQRGTNVAPEGARYIVMRNTEHVDRLVTQPFDNISVARDLFSRAVERFGDSPCLGERPTLKTEKIYSEHEKKDLLKLTKGDYVWQSFNEVSKRVDNFGAGLEALGQKPGQALCLYAGTKAEWLIALQASFRRQFPVATAYANLGHEAVEHVIDETEVAIIITDGELISGLAAMLKGRKNVKHVIYMGEVEKKDALEKFGSVQVHAFHDVEKIGASSKASGLPKIHPNDTAVIMYTSGSTGMPKGVEISHANIVAAVAGIFSILPDLSTDDVYIGYLPLAHILEMCAETTIISSGACIGYGHPLTLTDNGAAVKAGTQGDVTALRPTLMAAVPLVMDRVRHAVTKKVESGSPIKRFLFKMAFNAKLDAISRGQKTPFWDKLVFNKIKAVLGGRVRQMISGGAPLSAETQQFISAVVAPLAQGYGLTETCSMGTITDPRDPTTGIVGPPVPCCEIKLVDWAEGSYLIADKDNAAIGRPRGEVAISGGSLSKGYFKQPQKTAEDFRVDPDGKRWFYTGDIGQFEADGSLKIIDRKKDLVKLQAGEYVSLGKVEGALRDSPFIDNCMVYASSHNSYTMAVVPVNVAHTMEWAAANGVTGDLASICQDKRFNAAVLKSLQEVAAKTRLQRFEIPTKVLLQPEAWTPENDLVTAALKIKRHEIVKRFKKEIDQLYV